MTIVDVYERQTVRSAEANARARRSLPGGDTRTATFHRPYPLLIERAEGPYLWDADGNRYLDLLGNYTSLVHGNAYPPILRAVEEAARRGTAWAASNASHIALAELVCQRVTSVELVRFCNSGTEAGMLAAKVARHATGRPCVLRARSGYHGSYDDLEGEEATPRMLAADYGDAGSFEAVLAERGQEVAAVFLEPLQGGGTFVPDPEFIRRVQEAAARAGAVFVLDEVITLRLGEGGLQGAWDLKPDLTMMGKIVGGGFPVGLVGGSSDLMRYLDPSDGSPPALFHSGTFNGNPVTAAAGVVSLEELTTDRIALMTDLAASLRQGLAEAASHLDLPLVTTGLGSLLTVFFEREVPFPPRVRSDLGLLSAFHLACLNRGLFIAPRGMVVLSTAMTAPIVNDAIDRFALALRDVAEIRDEVNPEQVGV
jgi:glutamate-1-semialdehyde 2,1-aminomutase